MSRWRTGRMIAGKFGYGACCLLAVMAVVVSGYAHRVVGLTTDIAQGIAINGATINGSSNSSPSVGAMNILVMGLESRTNYEGQTLSSQQLTETHSGNVQSVSSGQVGSQDTDTLILIHIFAGGQKAVGFSIPRDDLVTFPHPTLDGITQGKIDQAYLFAYEQSLEQTIGTSMSSSDRYLKANQAGQAFEIATVDAVTGIHIDHFVEANLIGFYSLAQAFGGIEVCVKPVNGGANLTDSNSGWNAVKDGYNLKKGGIQYLHLAADQALAYVRDRDSLPQIDLDRTHRQQAVIDYVIWELKQEGLFSDLSKLNSLLEVASQYLITDSTFNLLDFVPDMRALTGQNLTFYTMPISGQINDYPLNGTGQDVNTINVPYIKSYIQTIIKDASDPAKTTARTKSATGAPATPAAGTPAVSTPAGSTATPATSAASSATAGTASQTPSPSATSTAGANTGQTGGAVTVAPNAKYGIPCVY